MNDMKYTPTDIINNGASLKQLKLLRHYRYTQIDSKMAIYFICRN